MKLLIATSSVATASDGARGAEREARELATGLAARGHATTVFARAGAEVELGGARLVRAERDDACPEHWQKSASPSVARAFRGLLERERPDVVHVHGWRGLTRELAYLAACARVPAVASVGDAWTHCLLGTRVVPATGAACTAPLGLHPCVTCAASVAPRTPWVPREAQYVAFAERERDVVRELALARLVCAPSPDAAAALRRFLPAAATLAIEVAEPCDAEGDARARWLAGWERRYARALAAGPPEVTPPRDDWYSDRVRAFALEQWDRAYRSRVPSGDDERAVP